MRTQISAFTIAALVFWLSQAAALFAQPLVLSESECQRLRHRLGEHTKLSHGVRQAVAARATTAPAPPASSGRAETIHARLAKILDERQQLEDQRVSAMVRLEFGRAAHLTEQIWALEREKTNLERDLAGLPAGTTTPPVAQPAQSPDVDRIRCQDMLAAYESAVKIRQKELGGREGQAGVVPLVALKGQNSEQIARELAAQFAAWPEAATQVGLVDQNGDGRLDGIVDVLFQDVFRLYRQRTDGTLIIEVFVLPGRAPHTAYSETTRRLDETTSRQGARTLADLLTAKPAGPVRMLGETAEFARLRADFLAGNFADAARVDGAAARGTEFQNFRGENVRVLEIIAPMSGGVGTRQVVVVSRPNNLELWEETVTHVRPQSYWRTDVEVVISRETRTTTGALVGTRPPGALIRFSLER